MKNSITFILESPIEDIKSYLESSSIIDILAILETIKKYAKMDANSVETIKEIESKQQIANSNLAITEKQYTIAEKTNASSLEISKILETQNNYNAEIDKLTSQKDEIIQRFKDKKQSIFTLAWNMILNAPVSKIEDYRNSLIVWLKNRIEIIESNKSDKEITTDTLLKERNFTKEDLTINAIGSEIKSMESKILNQELVFNAETISKMKSLRAKKDSLEHETFTYICTEKLKNSLKKISNDITKLQMELANIMHMDTNTLKELILSDYVETKETIKLANYSRIRSSYSKNVSQVPTDLKPIYRSICTDYEKALKSIENPSFEGKTLDELESELKEAHNYIKTLEQYKTSKIDTNIETKLLYTTVRSEGLFTLPFSKEKWLSYFGQYFEALLNDIAPLEEKNKEYIYLSSLNLKSDKVNKELEAYEEDLKYLLDRLYNKVLSLYLRHNLYINVNIYDYRDTETFTKYLEHRNKSIDREIEEVNNTVQELNRKKSNILELINNVYNHIDTVIKVKLNSILNGTYVKETKEDNILSSLPNNSLSYQDYNDTNDNVFDTIPTYNANENTEEVNLEIPHRETKKFFGDIPSSLDDATTFNPDDIFGETKDIEGTDLPASSVKASTTVPEVEESSISKVSEEIPDNDIINFEEAPVSIKKEEDQKDNTSYLDDISRTDQQAFKDLLEPKEPASFNTSTDSNFLINQEEPVKETPKRGLKVIKQEPVVAKKSTKVQEPIKTDALEIKERIENRELDKTSKPAPIFNPATANDVAEDYNDSNAPIDLNAFLNGNLATIPKDQNDTNSKEDKKLTLSPDDNVDLMNFLSQIETNDSKAA